MNKHKEMPELAVISSRGQLVIPLDLRREMHIKEGSVVALSSSVSKNTIIIKKIDNPIVMEDLKMAKDVEDAWQEIETGKYNKRSKNEFLKAMKKW